MKMVSYFGKKKLKSDTVSSGQEERGHGERSQTLGKNFSMSKLLRIGFLTHALVLVPEADGVSLYSL